MELFWKTVAAALVSGILNLMLEKQNRDFSLLVSLAASAMILLAAAKFLDPVITFLGKLEEMGGLSSDLLLSLIKIFGIGMAGEMAASVCADAGSSAVGKGLRFLTNGAMVYLSIPIFSSLIELLVQILGEL